MNTVLLAKISSVRVWIVVVSMVIWIIGASTNMIDWAISCGWIGMIVGMYFNRDRSKDASTETQKP